MRQRDDVGRRRDAAALSARVAFDQHRQLEPSAGHGGRQAFDHILRVRHDLHIGPTGEGHEAVELGLADKIVGQQNIGDASIDHDLGLAELLAIDALGAELDL